MRSAPTSIAVALLMSSLAFASLAPTSPAQAAQGFDRCGDPELVLIFKNPDLVPQEDGFIRASGLFFIQFQAIGDRAFDIVELAFSFGKPLPPQARTCDKPVNQWFAQGNSITGAYIYKYRSDFTPDDGFFITINTTNVPDGEYGAALSAFDASGTEIVRYYSQAKVENGCPLGGRGPCDYVKNDKVKPWPVVLPGDGTSYTGGPGGLTVEFAEPLLEDPQVWIKAHCDGGRICDYERIRMNLIPPEQTRKWDDDAVPEYPGFPRTVERVWGPAYHAPITIRQDDVIRVRAKDLNGNEVEKILHIGDPTLGGRIVLAYPELEIIGSGQEKTSDATGKAVFPFRIRNIGNGSAHGNLLLDILPEGLRAKFDKDHIVTGPGQTHHANLTVTALESLQPGTYEIKGTARYPRAGQEVTQPFNVKFILTDRANNTADDEKFLRGARPDEVGEEVKPATTTPEAETQNQEKGIPAPSALLVAAVAAAAALALVPGRRHR